MEIYLIFKSLLTLLFVLGLMFVSLWLVRYVQIYFSKNKVLRSFSAKKRLNVLENKRIDAKNSVVLLACDEKEYFVVLTQGSALLLDEKKIKKGSSNEN